jgi:hypothetical protein
MDIANIIVANEIASNNIELANRVVELAIEILHYISMQAQSQTDSQTEMEIIQQRILMNELRRIFLHQ